MVQLWKMQVETALFFEPIEQMYERVFRTLKPRTPIPQITVRYRRYANANSRIRLQQGRLTVDISDVLQEAPAPIQEALAVVLISKLYRKDPDPGVVARYRRYLNRSDVRRSMQNAKQQRGRKTILAPRGKVYDLEQMFEDLNFRYFNGLMSRPPLGWSVRPSRTTLGHYDPSHHVIVLSSILDDARAPKLIVEYVLFHEMLHLKFPTVHKLARRCVHTPEFKAAERQFDGFDEANKELRKFLTAN